MAPEFLERLPEWLATLVAETEKAITFPIGVQVYQEAAAHAGLRAQVEATHATIITPSVQRFTLASAYHELLHIRRHLVQGIPRLTVSEAVPHGLPFQQTAQMVVIEDNAIEHLVIVPPELQRFAQRAEYWVGRFQAQLQRIAAGIAPPSALDAAAITAWGFVRHVPPGNPIEQEVRLVLEQRVLLQQAEAALESIIPRLGDKRG
jgi:hypothetical protein